MFRLRRAVLFASVIPFLLLAGIAIAQVEEPPPETCPDDRGCVEVGLSRETLSGDFYLGETLLAAGQHSALLQIEPRTSQRIDVRNIQDSAEGFGDLFVWEDTSTTAWVAEGQTRQATVYPRQTYIRGTLNFTCDIRQAADTDDVACMVTIDEAPQPEPVLPDQRAAYVLDPGAHTLTVALTGEQAPLWSPASAEHHATVWTGGTAWVRSVFYKAGYLTITLDQPDVLGDFYLDDELVASQVASYEAWVAPYRTHRIAVRDIVDPAAGEVYRWQDTATSAYLSPGQTRTVTVRPRQEYLRGFLALTCTITNLQPGDSAVCQPSIDGVPVEPIPPGETAEYALEPGRHDLQVILGPESDWPAEPVTRTAYIYAGYTQTASASFTLDRSSPPPTAAGEVATVTRVFDGNTIAVSLNGAYYRVRYIGIEVPDRNQACAPDALAANLGLVAGRQVTLVPGPTEYDAMGRLMRYVYVGDTFVNAKMVSEGFGRVLENPSDTTYTPLFQQLEQEARAANRGCHATGLWAPPPAPEPAE
jgi:endonuclease YncB( thermonuclease family)